jgi:hypothetical protein
MARMPKLAIVVRPSPDWATIDRETYRRHARAFCEAMQFPSESISEVVELWDIAFQTSFFATRQRMKEIAKSNWLQVEDAVVMELKDWAAADFPAETWVAFVDDDDWFRPDLARSLPDAADFDGVVWQHSIFGWLDNDAVAVREETGFCYTNNYAVSAQYLEKHGVDSVLQHWDANKTFPALRIARVAEVLSMTNKHAASAMSLNRVGNDGPVKERLLKAVADYSAKVAAAECSSKTAWALPLIAQVQKHFGGLAAKISSGTAAQI